MGRPRRDRPLPRSRRARDGAGDPPRAHGLPRRRRAGPRRGGGGRPSADGLSPLAAGEPARARRRAVARPVLVPPGGEAAAEPGGVAVRAAVLAARARARRRRRLERPRPARAARRRPADVPLAPRARRRGLGRRARRRARVRGRAVPARAVDGASARPRLDPAPARAVDVRARSPRLRAGGSLPSALAIASIPASGQVHLALGAVPFYLAYAFVRTRERWPLVAAVAATGLAVAAGVLRLVVRDRRVDRRRRALAAPGGQVLGRVARLRRPARAPRHGELRLPRLADPARRDRRPRLPLPPPHVRARDPARARRSCCRSCSRSGRTRRSTGRCASCSTRSASRACPSGCSPSRASRSRRSSPSRCPSCSELRLPFRVPRQALVVTAIAVCLLLADLRVTTFRTTEADAKNAAYSALAGSTGRLVEVPVFRPGIHYGGVYLYYDMRAKRERPQGYSTLAPVVADTVAKRLAPINCGDWRTGAAALLDRLGVRQVMFHAGLFKDNPEAPDTAAFAWQGLVAHGYRPVATDGPVTLLAVRRRSRAALHPSPSRRATRPSSATAGARTPAAGGRRPRRTPRSGSTTKAAATSGSSSARSVRRPSASVSTDARASRVTYRGSARREFRSAPRAGISSRSTDRRRCAWLHTPSAENRVAHRDDVDARDDLVPVVQGRARARRRALGRRRRDARAAWRS